MQVTVIGAGLAGCEAAWQLAQRGIAVALHEMKPEKTTPAHHTADFAELCCSNSLRSDQIENAVGLLKEELRRLDSLILACIAAKCKTLLYCIKSPVDPLSQTSGKNTWFCGCIIGKLSGFCTNLHNLSLFYDDHTLTICNSNSGTA